jgi:hypothetical protein
LAYKIKENKLDTAKLEERVVNKIVTEEITPIKYTTSSTKKSTKRRHHKSRRRTTTSTTTTTTEPILPTTITEKIIIQTQYQEDLKGTN